MQYDMGKRVAGGEFIRTGSLNKPPRILLNALSSLKSEYLAQGSSISEIISEVWKKGKIKNRDFESPGTLNDRVFRADYEHVVEDEEDDNDGCELCDSSMVVTRRARKDETPKVHYGIIASGNQVMKHGVTRDSISKEHGVVCFEMEAAGLMDNFPCLVIRGICDYCDSHKNKEWQPYAALTAAACAKELLLQIPPEATKPGQKGEQSVTQNAGSSQQHTTISEGPKNYFSGNFTTGGSGKQMIGSTFNTSGPMYF